VKKAQEHNQLVDQRKNSEGSMERKINERHNLNSRLSNASNLAEQKRLDKVLKAQKHNNKVQ